MPWVSLVLGEDWDPQGEHSRPEYQDPKKGDGGGTSSRRMYEFKEDVSVHCMNVILQPMERVV